MIYRGRRSHFSERAHYLAALLDSLEDQISVIDRDGVIHYTNLAWELFGEQNGMPKGYNWLGVNYMGACDDEAEPSGLAAVEGILRVIRHQQDKVLSGIPLPQPRHPALVYDASRAGYPGLMPSIFPSPISISPSASCWSWKLPASPNMIP